MIMYLWWCEGEVIVSDSVIFSELIHLEEKSLSLLALHNPFGKLDFVSDLVESLDFVMFQLTLGQ